MFESLRRSIGMRMARFHFRSSREQVISFGHSIATSDRVLVVMPLTAQEEKGQLRVLTFLREHFYEPDITVIVPREGTPIERSLPRCRVLRIGPGDVSAFFQPSRTFLASVGERTYDLAIDLNLDFLMPSAYICKDSNARVRTGFAAPGADAFFNFQVRIEGEKNGTHAYDRLLQCLQMFFRAEGV